MTPEETEKKIKELEKEAKKHENYVIQLLSVIKTLAGSSPIYGRLTGDIDKGTLEYEAPARD